jgi:dihydrofolate synthase/folylpolyglutamate synthase
MIGYREALEYILSFADYERISRSGVIWDLRRIENLLEKLDNPHLAAKTVHVAGTKGKGSTTAIISSVINQAGYGTGLYTSPHLFSFTERIQANGRPIPEETFANLTEKIKPSIEAVNREGKGQCTTFEILTALGFTYFREIKADYQVIEVGLGGRLDATNVVRPEVCVITSISLDHTDLLGATVASIAGEKAGIIKNGNTVVCAPQCVEAMTVIEDICRQRDASLIKVGKDVTWRRQSYSANGQSFSMQGLKAEYDLTIPLLGDYQLENAAAAVTAVEVLIDRGAEISAGNIADGLKLVRWPGRLQVLRRNPWIIADGAHNAYSLQRLVEAIRQYFSFTRAILVMGTSSDKDIAGMVAEAASLTKDIIVTCSRNPRALKPEVLAGEFAKHGIKPFVSPDVASALKQALLMAGTGDLICATGSMFVVAEALEEISPQ